MTRQPSFFDKLISSADLALRTLVPNASHAERENPATEHSSSKMSEQQRQHIAGLMRINHTGEVCAQALYQGQALTARLPTVRKEMEQAAQEEVDHLAWCEQRLQQLNSQTSLLNPIFYTGSFLLGATAGALGDKWSLGFVAATEEQVCKHLEDHLEQLPEGDQQSRAILEQMLVDEKTHGNKAIEAGGKTFPAPVKELMTTMSKLMTTSTYRI
jgi:ubiquinone biosynthesis monooxygenase Coq7